MMIFTGMTMCMHTFPHYYCYFLYMFFVAHEMMDMNALTLSKTFIIFIIFYFLFLRVFIKYYFYYMF